MNRSRALLIGLVVGALGVLAPGPATGMILDYKLHPLDGAHWQAKVGLPDARGNARQGLAAIVDDNKAPDPHLSVAVVTGLEGQPTSELRRVGFAVHGEETGFDPCIKVAYTDVLGNEAEFMVDGSMMRRYVVEGHPDWQGYIYEGPWPPGTIQSIEIGVHVGNPDGFDGDAFVVFDNVEVNDQMWTHPGDNGQGQGVGNPDGS